VVITLGLSMLYLLGHILAVRKHACYTQGLY